MKTFLLLVKKNVANIIGLILPLLALCGLLEYVSMYGIMHAPNADVMTLGVLIGVMGLFPLLAVIIAAVDGYQDCKREINRIK